LPTQFPTTAARHVEVGLLRSGFGERATGSHDYRRRPEHAL